MSLSKVMPLVVTLAVVGIIGVATMVAQDKQDIAPPHVDSRDGATQDAAETRPAAIPSASRTAVHLPSAALPPDAIAERSPEEQERAQAARIADLDKKLRDEPFDTKWAREQEGIIARAVTGSKNDGLAVPLPDQMDATCQSTLCRITMTYADEEDAMQMHTKLTLGLRGSISSARAFYRPNQRGGMDLLVYAGAVD